MDIKFTPDAAKTQAVVGTLARVVAARETPGTDPGPFDREHVLMLQAWGLVTLTIPAVKPNGLRGPCAVLPTNEGVKASKTLAGLTPSGQVAGLLAARPELAEAVAAYAGTGRTPDDPETLRRLKTAYALGLIPGPHAGPPGDAPAAPGGLNPGRLIRGLKSLLGRLRGPRAFPQIIFAKGRPADAAETGDAGPTIMDTLAAIAVAADTHSGKHRAGSNDPDTPDAARRFDPTHVHVLRAAGFIHEFTDCAALCTVRRVWPTAHGREALLATPEEYISKCNGLLDALRDAENADPSHPNIQSINVQENMAKLAAFGLIRVGPNGP